ncbi:hypothetical protein PG997_013495 [Apiospora hydei]|uniref:C2H2-type domain-containing protein n=1 Tax=Apiospora hydei TaxID=1337664 RepID=A0ABR1V6C0_9PEZI
MDRGLDDLVEWLLTEIGFSGLQGRLTCFACHIPIVLTCRPLGFSPLHLVKAVKTFYTQTNIETETSGADTQLPLPSSEVVNSQEVGESDIVQASVVWNWLTARNDVIVGDDNRYKGISLKEALDISGYVPSGNLGQTSAGENETPKPAAQGSSAGNEGAGTDSRRPGKAVSKITPRLHLSEERLWKAITGHQPDLKKVPQFEWQALVAIASVREVGILQGDLVRLTNQDKRSLPTRTDALARKGYIVKQPVMLRGCRTSKIWLAQFAHHAKQETINEGLASAKVDLTRETLTKDWEPVPFSHFWNGARVDHIALAQGFLAIVKAFGKIRYCDIRIKLDIVGKTSQMRAMGKSSRWFTHRGIVEFRPMKAPDSNRVFKDCVEFIRDPTAEEWQAFRKTPTTRMRLKDPPSRRKDKSAASLHDSAKTGSKLSRSAQNELKTQQALIAKLPSPAMIRLSAWNPYKPLINTVFDIIKRSGTEGTSNLNIGYFLLGWPYRKWIFSMTTLLGQQRVHPEHLKPFSVTAQLARRGKTMTYSFFATSNIKPENGNAKLPLDGEQQETAENATTSDAPPTDLNIKYGFSRPSAKVFLRNSSAKYVSMPKKQELIPPIEPSEPNTPDTLVIHRTRRPKRSQPGHGEENSASEQLSETPTKRKRLLRGRKSSTPSLIGQVEETQPEPMDIDGPQPAETASAVPSSSQVVPESMPPPPLPSGVFYGLPNSLGPQKTKGRKRKSLVLVFRHPSLKKSSETGQQNVAHNNTLDTSSEQVQPMPSCGAEDPAAAEKNPVAESTSIGTEHPTAPIPESAPETVLPARQEDASTPAEGPGPNVSADQEDVSTPAEGAAPRNKGSKRGDKRFTCETCGNSWKNTNGLEYHKKKSQSTCNPTWVPPPPSLEILSVRRAKPKERSLPKMLTTPSKSPKVDQERSQLVLPTKRPNRARPETPQETPPVKGSQSSQSTVLLSVGQIHNGPGLSAAGKRVLPGANESFRGTEQLSHVHTSVSQPSVAKASPLVPETDIGAVLQGSNARPVSGVASAGATSTPTPVLDLPDRATPEHPLSTPKHSVTPQAQALQKTPSNSSNIGGTVPAPAAQRDTKQRSSKATTAQRRIRTTSLIEELLRENGGAFPGDHALHVVISSIWPRRFNDDVDPPDQRTCDIIVKKMIGAKVIRQDHYGFRDYQGNVKSISVISKASDGQGEEALTEKILGIKAKSIELYPDPYIPPGLSMLGGPNQAEALGIGETGSIPTAFTSIAKGSIRKSVLTLDYHMPVEASTLPRGYPRRIDSRRLIPPREHTRRDVQDSFSHALLQEPGLSLRPEFTSYPYPMATNVGAGQLADHQTDGMEIDATDNAPGRGRGRGRGRGVGRGRGRGRGRGNTTGRGRGAGQGLGRGRGRGGKRVNVALDDDYFARQANAARYTWASESDLSVLWNLDADLPNVQRAIQLSESTRVLYPQPSDFTEMQQDDSDDDDEDRFLAEIPPQGDDVLSDKSDTAEACSNASPNFTIRFAPARRIEALGDGSWPAELPKGPRPGGVGESFAMIGRFPTSQWFLKENLPQNAQEMISMAPDASQRPSQARGLKEPSYEDFVQNLMGIEAWELSSEGVYLQFSGTAAPEYKFISLGVGETHTSTLVTSKLEWQKDLQYTAANLPQDILEAPFDDEICIPQRVGSLAAGELMAQSAPPPTHSRKMLSSKGQWKTPSGRWNQRSEAAAEVGLFDGEHHLLVAFLVLKALVGGVEKIVDWGMLIRLFPQMSLSGLRRFWSKMGKERKSFIDAFNARFPAAFLEAYEQGKLPPMDYDSLGAYDWKTLINWAAKLKTHQQVELPPRREVLEDRYSLQEPPEIEARWRDEWFGPITSAYARIDGSGGEPLTVPLGSDSDDDIIMKLAISWIKALCNSKSRCTVGEDVRDGLAKLGRANMDKKSLNTLLERAVSSLMHDRVISRVKGKFMGQVFKLNNNFERRAEKLANMENGETMLVPLDANAGTIMAIINLQAQGRIVLQHENFPDVPFGFEPSNYEGRMFPKSYYSFDVRLTPSDKYLYSEDIPMAIEANHLPVPEKGPVGELPIWRDFFGNLEAGRWVQYVCLVVFALATKGPLNAKSAATLLHPMVEIFEVNLIVQWIQSLGILELTAGNHGWTVGEWWWLIIGNMVDLKGKGAATA